MIENINEKIYTNAVSCMDKNPVLEACEVAILEKHRPTFHSKNRCFVLTEDGSEVEFIVTNEEDSYVIDDIKNKTIIRTMANLSYMFLHSDNRFVKPVAFDIEFKTLDVVFSSQMQKDYINETLGHFLFYAPGFRFHDKNEDFFSFDLDGNLLYFYNKKDCMFYDVHQKIKFKIEKIENLEVTFEKQYDAYFIKDYQKFSDIRKYHFNLLNKA